MSQKISDKISAIFKAESEAIDQIPMSKGLIDAVQALLECEGKVFTTGIGKAGYIAKKAASTFCTTGTAAVFLHPGDAPHGDVGAITKGDILICLSNSGKNREVVELLHFCRRLGLKHAIAITANPDSPLAKECEMVIELGKIKEPCPLGLTPTASTAAMLAICDALALVAMEERGFSKEDFALRHHGGYLGIVSREEQK
jgi:arabinose-5-phosphate isomerase